MATFTDQTGRTISLQTSPKRIISLVPSQTELLYELQLEEQVVGITKFCVHPEQWFRNKKRMGGTKDIHLETIRQLQPDLILANKEENVREQVTALWDEFPTWVSDVHDLDSALDMIHSISSMTGKKAEGNALAGKIRNEFDSLGPTQPISAAYLIWKDPYMTIGGDTFIHQMMHYAGFENVFSGLQRYPAITLEDLRDTRCNLVLLSSEPYPFREKHRTELQQQLPGVEVLLADGELFSWYGSRMQYAPAYYRKMRQQVSGR